MKKIIWTWLKRVLLVLIICIIIWAINFIWFKPFNIEHFYNRAFVKILVADPELVTQLNIPVLSDLYKDELTDESDKANWERFNIYKNEYGVLKDYDRNSLSEKNKLNSDILSWFVSTELEREDFFYHNYTNDHIKGKIIGVSRTLQEKHPFESKSDIKAYVKRLEIFENKVNQLIEQDNIRAEKGILPPSYILEKTISVVDNLIKANDDESAETESHGFYDALQLAISENNEISENKKSEFLDASATVIKNQIVPSLIRYKENLVSLKAISDSSAGVWKLPNGEEYYKYKLKKETTTNLDPNSIHEIGLNEVERITTEISHILRTFYSQDSVRGNRELAKELAISRGSFIINTSDNTIKEELLENYSQIVKKAESSFSSIFNIMPRAKVSVEPTPDYLGISAPHQYSYKKDRGVFYLNTLSAEEQDTIFLIEDKSLAYHEAIPGHHFQIAIQRELEDLPRFRSFIPFTAYTEGWALYAEQLAYEAGLYDNDPVGNLGRLNSELFRSVRLVVDTGLHYKQWTRVQAISYIIETLGWTSEAAENEIDRYIILPGQACAYKVGMLKILELRDLAKRELGEDFDISEFHDVILGNGAVPLDILETLVKKYIDHKKTNDINN